MQTIRIFISSPSDVREERQVAGKVIERLQGKYWSFVRLDDVFWEDRAVRATAHYQDELVHPGDCEIVIGILWSRLGSPLPAKFTSIAGRNRTGTEWELEEAFSAYERTRESLVSEGVEQESAARDAKPDILVYRRFPSPDVTESESEKTEQLRLLEFYLSENYFFPDRTIRRPILSYENLDDFESKLTSHVEELILRAIPGLQPGFEPPPISGCPFKGLKAFGYTDSDRFFGRNRQIREVQNRLRSRALEGTAFVLIYGASGYGKSSLMRAGVAPALTKPGGSVQGADCWRRVTLQPALGEGGLCEYLAQLTLSPPPKGEADMAKSHEHFALSGLPELLDFPIRDPKAADEKWGIENLSRYLADPDGQIFAVEGVVECLESIGHWLLLQIDQMEEVFAETVNKGDRAAFFGFLHRLAQSGRVWVLATMRSEFFREIAREPELRSLLGSDGGYILPPPDTQSWSEIIRYPAMAARLNWERSMESRKIGSEAASKEWLDEQILDEIEGQSDALPLLEFCLERLYSKRSGTLLTWAAYEEMGGIRGAIAKVADDAFQNLPATAREALDFVFANLVRVDETTTRRRANLDQLQRHHGADEFLFAFQEAKLLSTGDEDGITVVTLVHESLLTHWPVLAEWIERHRNDLTAHQRLIRQAELWEANRESPKYLLTAGHLAEAERVAGSSIFLLSESQSKFLRRSRRAAQRKLRVFQFATVVFAALALLAALLGRKAVLARSDAQHALATLQGDKADTLFLRDDKIEAIPYLTSLLKKHPSNHLAAERLVSALTYRSFPLPHTRELTHGSRIHKVEFHPGGRYLGSAACAEFDGRAVLWDIDSGEILRSFRHDLCVEDLSFSADGRFLATASRDRTAKIWNIETGEAVSPPLEHKDEVKKVWLDATGTKLVSTTKGGESVLWEVSTGKRLLDLNSFGGGETKILSAQFSPDNRYLLVNFAYTNSVLIDCGTLESSEVFRNVGQGIFNRDGTKMAFAFPWSPALTFYDPIHRDRLSSRHHLDDPRNFRSPESPIESERLKIQGFDFSPEGQSVVAYLEGGDLRRIDLEQSHVLPHAQRSTRKVLTLKTFPDGLHAAARTEGWRQSDTVVLNLFPGETATGVMWHGKGALAIHPTRPLIATSSSQETKRSIRVWDTRPGEAFPQVRVFDGGITILSESSNRNHFAVVSDKESLLSVCRTSDLSVIDTHVFDSPIRALAMDETTDAFIVGLSDGRIFHGKVTDAGAVQEVLTVDGQIFGLILHPDGSAFAVIRRFPELRGRSPRVTTYCFDTFKVLFDQEIDFIPVDPWNFGWGANGSVFVSPALDYSYRLVTGDSGKPLVNQGLKALARVGFKSQRGQLMAFDPTDSRVATTNKEVARVFRSDNGDPVTAPMLHDGDVNSLDFHPSGKWLVTASEDGTARIWDAVGRGGEQVALSMEHGLPVIDAQFSPDGSRILTLTRMAARLWDTETGQPISDPFPLPATKTPADSAKGWARFCDGGQAILLASGDGRVARWETPTCPLPVPEWFCHLAESVVGERLDERGMPQPVDFGDLVGERNRALGFGESDRFYERFAHWFFSDRSKRSPAPESRRAMDDQVHYWIENATLPELLRARLLHPENREILKRIAANLKNSPHESERELARFLGSNLDRLTSANP